MATWMRDHRHGATTAMVAKVSGTVYVAYTMNHIGLSPLLVDNQVLEAAQAAADRFAGCPQPCACPPWLEITRKRSAYHVRAPIVRSPIGVSAHQSKS
jgi:hypothetical protein